MLSQKGQNIFWMFYKSQCDPKWSIYKAELMYTFHPTKFYDTQYNLIK